MSKLALLGGEKTRKKPFVMGVANIGPEERQRVSQVLDSGMLSGFIANNSPAFYGGKQVLELETALKKYFAVEFAISVNSATAGLHCALAACGIAPGDEVIVPPYTMSASATAVVMSQGIPIFADIEANSYAIDPISIEKRITRQTKAIVVVHLFGKPAANMAAIMALAKKHELAVIEDCAQSPGAKIGNDFVGTIGHVGIFSLNQHKTITSGEGGFCLTKDARLAKRMQLVRNHGEVIVGPMEFEEIDNMIGYNYRMTELEAAVSVAQFEKLDMFTEHRIQLANHLIDGFRDFDFLITPEKSFDRNNVFFVFPFRFLADKAGFSREIFTKALLAEGIPLGAGYVRPIYLEPMYQKQIAYGKEGWPFTAAKNTLNYQKGLCMVCERMHYEELLVTGLCRYPNTIDDMNDVIQAVKKIANNKSALLETV